MSWSRAALPIRVINSRWWLSFHRRSLQSLGDHARRDRVTRRRKLHGLQFHPPRTTAAAPGDCLLLLPTAGGSLTQNPGKIGPLIQAVLELTSAPASFWDRGVCWFLVRIYGLEQSYSVFSVIRWLFEKRPFLMPRQDKASPSRATRGYRNSREHQRSRRHGDLRRLEVRGERLSRSAMKR